jgi:hypothetical protein
MLLVGEHVNPLLLIATVYTNETTSLGHVSEWSLWTYRKGVLV